MTKEEVRVVLVDDDADMRDTLTQLLEHDGYTVRSAPNAAEARKAVAEHDPLCVLIDLGLPDVDGCELARELRISHGADLVLIAITGWSRQADRERAEEAGVDFVLQKPVSADGLRRFLPPL